MSEPINNLYTTINSLETLLSNCSQSDSNIFNNDTLYDVISQKDEIINNLQETNEHLSKIISNFNKHINNTNKKISEILSRVSTNRDIDQIMINEKTLKKNIDLLTEHNKKLTRNLLLNNSTYNNLKNTYFGLNKLYIAQFNNTFQINNSNEVLANKINMLEDKLANTNNMFKCQICFNNTIDIIIMPCFHIYICKECVEQIIENTHDNSDVNCPVCNERIIEYKNIYLPI